jgi:hypothetical protein
LRFEHTRRNVEINGPESAAEVRIVYIWDLSAKDDGEVGRLREKEKGAVVVGEPEAESSGREFGAGQEAVFGAVDEVEAKGQLKIGAVGRDKNASNA